MTRRPVHYVLSTHWDREWYQTLQDYRYRLVQLIDRVLDGFESGALQGPFTSDGQAVMLEDYLEVRPERRATIEACLRDGRICAGPWYAMPDEFIISGESLVRNLRLGRDLVREMGGTPSKAGFVCDIFGHNSQFPQILMGFDILAALIWRGSNHLQGRNLLWRGADGTTIPAYRFGNHGYCSFAIEVRRATQADAGLDPDRTLEALDEYMDDEVAKTDVDAILAFDGCDHQEWDARMYPLILDRIADADGPFAWRHSTLDAYIDDMLPQADRISATVEGELREPADGTPNDQQWLIAGVISSRVWIKQWNTLCQNMLCHWAEPSSALATLALGREYPAGFLNVAWRWLLRNHPHDSICGCSIDAVHEDMRFRFHQCEGIADRLTIEATKKIAANVAGEIDHGQVRACVFNPLPVALDEPVTLKLQVPPEWPSFGRSMGKFEKLPAFTIRDAQGNEVPYQRLSQTLQAPKLVIHDRGQRSFETDDIEVALDLAVPAMGYTTLTVQQAEMGKPTRHPQVKGLAVSECVLENELLRVTVEPNGTLTLLDKRNDASYSRLLTFEDVADIGDGWNHGPASNDQAFVSRASSAGVALVHDGPLMSTLRVRLTLTVPAAFNFDRTMTRSDAMTDLIIDSLVTLRAGADRVEISTTVHNTARDHRLRVLFPTGAQTDTYLADTPFDVVERAIALRADNYRYRELEIEAKPQQSWTAAHDDARGLAVIADGLLETAVRDLPERPIALTLFRGTQRTVMTAGEPNGQLLGEMTFRYWLLPLGGAPDRARLSTLGQQLGAGLRTAYVGVFEQTAHGGERELPAEGNLLAVEGDVVVTSTRFVGDGLELRLFNPNTAFVSAKVLLGSMATRFTQAQRVNLESKPLDEPTAIEAGALNVDLGPKQIATVRLS